MTPEEVTKEVEIIRGMSGDAEIAHGREDNLYLNLLLAISRGECKDPKTCAAIAIETQAIEFPRWCA